MSSDTKAIIGTIVGTGLVLGGLLTTQLAGVNTRIDDVNDRIDDVRSDMRDIRSDVRDVRASLERFDGRLDAVEVAFGKVDQRLLTIERVVLPPPPAE